MKESKKAHFRPPPLQLSTFFRTQSRPQDRLTVVLVAHRPESSPESRTVSELWVRMD